MSDHLESGRLIYEIKADIIHLNALRNKLEELGLTDHVNGIDRCLSKIPEPVVRNLSMLPFKQKKEVLDALRHIRRKNEPLTRATGEVLKQIQSGKSSHNATAINGTNQAEEALWNLCGLLLVATNQITPHPENGTAYDAEILGRWNGGIKETDLKKITHGSILTGQYDEAISSAAKLVEDRLRNRLLSEGCLDAKGKTGSDLVGLAFGKTNGLLIPPWDKASEAKEGAGHLFRGFFLYIRNGFSHQMVGNTGEGAFELIALAESLLKIIELSMVKQQTP